MTEPTHEQALVGALLYYGKDFQPLLHEAQPEYFADKQCGKACRVMHEQDKAGTAINRITVLPRLGISEEVTDDPFMVKVDQTRTRLGCNGAPPFFSRYCF